MTLWLLYGPGDPGYDARYALVWGDAIRHLHAPDYGAPLSPTPHPLSNLIGAAASLGGRSAADLLMAFSYACFAALGLAAYAVGRRSFGTVAGVALAAILLTRPLLVGEALDASVDIPFLALVLLALALELGRSRRGAPVLAVLALAGLLRPEAWLLALAYAVYLRPRARLVALACAGPILWLLSDLITTGDPFFSLTTTQDLAAKFERDRGLGSALGNTPVNLEAILGSELVWVSLAVCVVALVLAQRRARLPVAILALGLAGFLVLGVVNLPLLTRYLLVPATMLALFCAAGLAGFEWLRAPGWVLSAGVAVALATGVGAARDDIHSRRANIERDAANDSALLSAANRADARCRPVQAAAYRAVPVLAYRLGLSPSDVHVVRPARARGGLVFTGPAATLIGDVGLYPGVTVRSQELVPPRGFTRIAGGGPWTLFARC